MIHNIKSTYVSYHHVEGFQDCSMYKENKWGLEIVTWVEKPCMCLLALNKNYSLQYTKFT